MLEIDEKSDEFVNLLFEEDILDGYSIFSEIDNMDSLELFFELYSLDVNIFSDNNYEVIKVEGNTSVTGFNENPSILFTTQEQLNFEQTSGEFTVFLNEGVNINSNSPEVDLDLFVFGLNEHTINFEELPNTFVLNIFATNSSEAPEIIINDDRIDIGTESSIYFNGDLDQSNFEINFLLQDGTSENLFLSSNETSNEINDEEINKTTIDTESSQETGTFPNDLPDELETSINTILNNDKEFELSSEQLADFETNSISLLNDDQDLAIEFNTEIEALNYEKSTSNIDLLQHEALFDSDLISNSEQLLEITFIDEGSNVSGLVKQELEKTPEVLNISNTKMQEALDIAEMDSLFDDGLDILIEADII